MRHIELHLASSFSGGRLSPRQGERDRRRRAAPPVHLLLPLLALSLLPAGCTRDPGPAVDLVQLDAAISRGALHLLERQSPDGRWRSDTYGLYRDGDPLTAHVTTVLAVLRPRDPGTRRGIDQVAGWVGPDGTVTATFGNPVYTASEASMVMLLALRPEQAAFVDLIRRHQFGPDNGWTETDPQFGGWSDAALPPARPADDSAAAARDANISATLFAVGALRFGGAGPDDPAVQAAADFALRCRNHDGGYFFSPIDTARNKGGTDAAGRPHSYGSATADAVRLLLAAGLSADNPAIVGARRWLVTHFDPARHPGTFNNDREVLRDAYDHYWAWTAAHAMDRLQIPTATWAPALAAELLRRQNPDGSFTNRYTDGKEDDPLVATPLALAALRICRDSLANPVR